MSELESKRSWSQRAYFFGCVQTPGHFWWDLHLRGVSDDELPRGLHAIRYLDGRFAPKVYISGSTGRYEEAPQGQCVVVHLNDTYDTQNVWTIIAFWDRSVDKRGACNSAFIIPGKWTFAEALEMAKLWFPGIFKRFTFELVEFKEG